MENIRFVSVQEGLPETNGSWRSVYIKTIKNGTERIAKGMFYMNGGNPVFASYGSPVPNVTEWAYR